MPKQTRQTVLRCALWQALSTIRKMMTASGPPKERGRLVTRMKIGPRRASACSFAASEAEVEDAGYSPDDDVSGNLRRGLLESEKRDVAGMQKDLVQGKCLSRYDDAGSP